MYILLTLIGGFLAFVGLFIGYMFPTDQFLGLALIGIGCFFGILGRMAQASNQHDEILDAWRGKIPDRHAVKEMRELERRAQRRAARGEQAQ